MRPKSSLLLIFVMVISIHSFTQETFSKVFFHQTDGIQVTALSQSADSNYVMVGFETVSYWEYMTGLVVKFDKQGNTIWSKILVSPIDYTIFTDIIPCSDSGFIILGQNESNIILMKMNQQGDIVWAKKSDWEIRNLQARAICPTFGKGFAIVGNYNELPIDTPYFTFVSTFDESGNSLWTDTFGLTEANSIVQLPDSTLLITGDYTQSYLMNLQDDGSVNWYKNIFPDSYHSYALEISGESIYSLFSLDNDILGLRKLDFEFNQQWFLQIDLESGNFWNNYLQPKMISTPDSGIIIVNQKADASGNLLKITKDGTISWAKELVFMGADAAIIGDSAYMIVGNGISWPVAITRTDLNGNGSDCISDINVTSQFLSDTMIPDFASVSHQYDSFVDFTPVFNNLQLTEQQGCVLDFIREDEPKGNLKILPNPANESFKVEVEKIKYDNFKQLEISDLSGRLVFQTTDQNLLKEGIHTSQFLPGVYQVVLLTKYERYITKLMIVR
ncbi:MAG: T9SS type A sorting domain-containing protein [Bacteroidales bacterium]